MQLAYTYYTDHEIHWNNRAA